MPMNLKAKEPSLKLETIEVNCLKTSPNLSEISPKLILCNNLENGQIQNNNISESILKISLPKLKPCFIKKENQFQKKLDQTRLDLIQNQETLKNRQKSKESPKKNQEKSSKEKTLENNYQSTKMMFQPGINSPKDSAVNSMILMKTGEKKTGRKSSGSFGSFFSSLFSRWRKTSSYSILPTSPSSKKLKTPKKMSVS